MEGPEETNPQRQEAELGLPGTGSVGGWDESDCHWV